MNEPLSLEAQRAEWRTPLVVANLKANKTLGEFSDWLEEVGTESASFIGTVVICPSFPFLAVASQKLAFGNWPLKLGSQDISKFEQGSYTGEVAASQIASICQYAIIGHSERRQNFKENDEVLFEKVANAQKANLEIIYCVQSEKDEIPGEVKIVAYEPVFAIGTGSPDTPQNAKSIAERLKTKGEYTVLYGGSVRAENVKSYLFKDLIDGVLVGATNSLDPQKFIQILKSASY